MGSVLEMKQHSKLLLVFPALLLLAACGNQPGHGTGLQAIRGAVLKKAAPSSAIPDATELKRTITEALAKVQALTGVTFTMAGSDTRQMGLIAQEVQAVAPETVVEAEGVLRLAYGNLVGLLVEAIKDLAQEVDQLKRTAP